MRNGESAALCIRSYFPELHLRVLVLGRDTRINRNAAFGWLKHREVAFKKTNVFLIPPVSPIFKAVREKRCKAWYTLAKRSPTAPESALARDSEPSHGDTRGGPPSPQSASPLATLRVTARLSGEPFPVWHSRHPDRLTAPLQPPTDAAPRTPPASRPVAPSITTASAPWHGRLVAQTSG